MTTFVYEIHLAPSSRKRVCLVRCLVSARCCCCNATLGFAVLRKRRHFVSFRVAFLANSFLLHRLPTAPCALPWLPVAATARSLLTRACVIGCPLLIPSNIQWVRHPGPLPLRTRSCFVEPSLHLFVPSLSRQTIVFYMEIENRNCNFRAPHAGRRRAAVAAPPHLLALGRCCHRQR